MNYSYAMFSSTVTGQQRGGVASDCNAAVKVRMSLGAGLVSAVFLASALCVLIPRAAHAQANASAAVMGADPTAMVKAVIDQATDVVRDTQTPTAARDKRLREIAEANFDFADMARTTLGYHWRQLTPQQQAEFVPLFASFMENVYLSKLQEYSVEKIRQTATSSNVSFTGQQYDGANYAEVHSTVLLKDQPPPVKVDYLVRRDGQLSPAVQPRAQQRRLPGARGHAAQESAGTGLYARQVDGSAAASVRTAARGFSR